MLTRSRTVRPALTLLCLGTALGALVLTAEPDDPTVEMPWHQAGLTERQAAAHLLDRFTYGPRPGEVDRVVDMGLERWFERQLDGNFEEPRDLERLLDSRPTLEMDTAELAQTYPAPGMVLALAVQEGVVERPAPESVRGSIDSEEPSGGDDFSDDRQDGRRDSDMRRTVLQFAREQGFKSQREAMADLMIQKLARARYAENQLHEVLADFWFNHFNVSLTDNQARIYLWPYERDAIRSHVVGSFRDMLGATARHPAMLLYLDNALSVADESATTTLDLRLRESQGRRGRSGRFARADRRRDLERDRQQDRQRDQQPRRASGLNENYARELMELHTLGVDGGYTQDDVVDVARAFTGWTLVPPRGLPERLERADDRRRRRAGFVIDGTFLFRADAHDAETKTVLGTKLAAGRGIEDGEDVLDLLAAHPSTARHLAAKLATRFVSDQPPASLVDRLAETYLDQGGDLRAMMVTLVESPEFWSVDAIGQKIKSPLELAMSALRAVDAHPRDPRELFDWIRRMGQPLYAYQAPTGFPDRADAWVNTGALLQRMNFGLQLATGRIPGVRMDLEPFAHGLADDASSEERLRHWLALLLPERDPEPTVRRLLPVVDDPDLGERIADAAPDVEDDGGWNPLATSSMDDEWDVAAGPGEARRGRRAERASPPVYPDDSLSAQVVGVILGSPEFQRR